MRIISVPWINSQGSSSKRRGCVWSVDVHPKQPRFATGSIDGSVNVWSLDAVLSSAVEAATTARAPVANVGTTGSVMSVRWSNHTGSLLAACSDDRNVYVWVYGVINIPDDDGTMRTKEMLTNPKILRGHAFDVVQVAWSPDNALLASCGMDGTVFVWSTDDYKMVKKLDSHEGFVKGVVWDPAGRYLASQSDDRKLRVWRTSDWQTEHVIEKPFKFCEAETYFMRLDWSPEGSIMVAANCAENGMPLAMAILRDGWRCDLGFAGFKLPVQVVKFNPVLFRSCPAPGASAATEISNTSSQPGLMSPPSHSQSGAHPASSDAGAAGDPILYLATAANNTGVAIWSTKRMLPLLVVDRAFTGNVTDLSWSSDGMKLLISSESGIVTCLHFKSEELGFPMSKSETYRRLENYGLKQTDRNSVLPENPHQLILEQQNRAAPLPPAPPAPARVEAPTVTAGKPASGTATPATDAPSKPAGDAAPRQAGARQAEEKTTDGKRRIKPQYLGPLLVENARVDLAAVMNDPATPTAASVPSALPEASSSTAAVVRRLDSGAALPTASRSAFDPPGASSSASALAASGDAAASSSDPMPSSIDVDLAPVLGKRPPVGPGKPPAIKRRRVTDGDSLGERPMWTRIGGLVADFGPGFVLGASSSSSPAPVVVEAVNQKDGSWMRCTHGDTTKWQTRFASPVVKVASSALFCVAACADASLHIFSPAGRRIMLPILISQQASHLRAMEEYLLAVSADGFMYMWNVARRECRLSYLSTQAIARSAAEIHMLSMDRTPASTWNAGSGAGEGWDVQIRARTPAGCFVLDSGMCAWSRVSTEGASADPTAGTVGGDEEGQVQLQVQMQMEQMRLQMEKASRMMEMMRRRDKVGESVEALEMKLASYASTNDAERFKVTLSSYAARLARDGMMDRMRELCDELSGRTRMSPMWASMGVDGRRLLGEVLQVAGRTWRGCQGLVEEYAGVVAAGTSSALSLTLRGR